MNEVDLIVSKSVIAGEPLTRLLEQHRSGRLSLPSLRALCYTGNVDSGGNVSLGTLTGAPLSYTGARVDRDGPVTGSVEFNRASSPFTYRLTREPAVCGPARESETWFSGTRDGDAVRLLVFGRVSEEGIDTLPALFAGARSAHVTIVDCVGGVALGAQAICQQLRDLGPENVRCRVEGLCGSCANWIPCFSGRVSASPDARFVLHGPTSVFLAGDVRDKPASQIFSELDHVHELMAGVLSRRIANPEQYLTTEDQSLTAEQARGLGLADVIY